MCFFLFVAKKLLLHTNIFGLALICLLLYMEKLMIKLFRGG